MAHLGRLIATVALCLPAVVHAYGLVPPEPEGPITTQPPTGWCTTFQCAQAGNIQHGTLGEIPSSILSAWVAANPPNPGSGCAYSRYNARIDGTPTFTDTGSAVQVGIVIRYDNSNSACTVVSPTTAQSRTVIPYCSLNPFVAATKDPLQPVLSRYFCQLPSPGGCPPDSTEVGGDCVCNNGFQPDEDNQCVPTNCQAVRNELRGLSLVWPGNSPTVCLRGCSMYASVRGFSVVNNQSSTNGEFLVADSSSCMGANNGANTDGNDAGAGQAATTCPVGQCPGTVNGAAVCAACSSTSQQGPQQSATPASGAPAAQLPNAPTGAVSSSTTTECIGGNCTTTTTYRDANGSQVGTAETTEPESQYCADNPDAPICKTSSIAGACNEVACEGDPIQCAIAKEQARRACEFFEPTGPVVEAGQAAASGEATPDGHPAGNAQTFAFGELIDTTDRLGGGCPADFSVTIAGQAMNVPMSQLCSPLALLGQVLVAVSMLGAVFIVFRG